jgi:hypothetical protein
VFLSGGRATSLSGVKEARHYHLVRDTNDPMGLQVTPRIEKITDCKKGKKKKQGATDIESLNQLLYQNEVEVRLTKLAYDMVVKTEK